MISGFFFGLKIFKLASQWFKEVFTWKISKTKKCLPICGWYTEKIKDKIKQFKQKLNRLNKGIIITF